MRQEKAGKKKRVFVGMSGGVDSSVSAALLKKEGCDVTGVFIKVWQPKWIECSWREDRRDAMRAAAHLDIPFVTLDLEKEYKEGVIDYMLAEYAAGRTPNPDVMCNREVKFGAFWQWAKAQGADYIATGHYAQIAEGRGRRVQGAGEDRTLLAGADANKDQSYFLWTLTPDDLAHALFPVGHLEKPHVRALAQKFGLPNAAKKDSQGLCFIGHVDIKEFLSREIGSAQKPGAVLNERGETIGAHPGALFFTIGERHGFSIDADKKSPHDRPFYIIAKNIEQNTLTVAHRDETASSSMKQVDIDRVNWIPAGRPEAGMKLLARCRYRQPLEEAALAAVSADGSSFSIEFSKPQTAVTPGQSLVMYDLDGRECFGGGIIR